MLGIQTRAFETPAEKAKEGICAVIYGRDESYEVEIYRINSKVAAMDAKDVRPDDNRKFCGADAIVMGKEYIKDVCGESPVFVNEGSRLVRGNGFSAICASIILGKYIEDYF